METLLDLTTLAQFTGSTRWYGLNDTTRFTQGAKYLAENAGAYWLLEAIALAQCQRSVAEQPFQLWTLVLEPNDGATLSCEDGNGNFIYTQWIRYTDFPLPEISLYYTDDTILLPSEY